MTTVNMQPGEHDLVTDILGGIVAGLTLGLVDLTAGDPEPAAPAARPSGFRCELVAEDRERE